MTNQRGILLLGLPVVAGGLLLAAVVLRGGSEPTTALRATGAVARGGTQPGMSEHRSESMPRPSSAPAVPLAPVLKMPVAKDLPTAAVNARVLSTYQNYRTAVVNNNEELQNKLLSVLRRDRDMAMGYAREDAAQARTDQDRAIALRTLRSLER